MQQTNPFENLQPENAAIAKAITSKLAALGFYATFNRVEPGPVVTSYFFKPLATSPLAKVLNKTEDIALACGVESVLIQRILNEISIMVPNKERTLIRFDDCLWQTLQIAQQQKYHLPLMLGKGVTGETLCLDLVTQPHLLIAGSTGAGKSVFLSELICGLSLMKASSELKLILVDTKQLDLTLFNSLDHTLEMIDKIEDLYDVLHMLKKEVRLRTELMKGLARNITEYNRLGYGQKPYYVLIIDELADVIGQDKELAKNEDKDSKRIRISDSIKGLAQISRAAGIHIIAATQRPSIKVIDGDIKANFPTRICFKLPTGTDSRVVLDENGAEFLLGKGDFLYRTAQTSEVKRGHGAFVSMEDIARVVAEHEQIRETFQNQFEVMRGV